MPMRRTMLLGRQLDVATRVLMARVPVVAIKVALGGFDTHANQVQPHERLLAFLAQSLATLRKNLIAARRMERRGGDDLFGVRPPRHGRTPAAAPTTARPRRMFVMGGGVKGGLHGAYPSLADLTDGDLKHTVDFRSVFATVAQGCWDQSARFRLSQPQRLGFLFSGSQNGRCADTFDTLDTLPAHPLCRHLFRQSDNFDHWRTRRRMCAGLCGAAQKDARMWLPETFCLEQARSLPRVEHERWPCARRKSEQAAPLRTDRAAGTCCRRRLPRRARQRSRVHALGRPCLHGGPGAIAASADAGSVRTAGRCGAGGPRASAPVSLPALCSAAVSRPGDAAIAREEGCRARRRSEQR